MTSSTNKSDNQWVERYSSWCEDHTGELPYTAGAEVTRHRLVHFLRDGVMLATYGWNRKRKRAAVDDIQDEDAMDADRKALRDALSEDEQYLLSHTMSPAGLTELRISLEGINRLVTSPISSTELEECASALVSHWRKQCRDYHTLPVSERKKSALELSPCPVDEGVAFLVEGLAKVERIRRRRKAVAHAARPIQVQEQLDRANRGIEREQNDALPKDVAAPIQATRPMAPISSSLPRTRSSQSAVSPSASAGLSRTSSSSSSSSSSAGDDVPANPRDVPPIAIVPFVPDFSDTPFAVQILKPAKAIMTVTDLWTEYDVGLDGGPSMRHIYDSEDIYRADGHDYNYREKLKRRKAVISLVQDLSVHYKGSCQKAAKALERWRTAQTGNVTIAGLSTLLRGLDKEKRLAILKTTAKEIEDAQSARLRLALGGLLRHSPVPLVPQSQPVSGGQRVIQIPGGIGTASSSSQPMAQAPGKIVRRTESRSQSTQAHGREAQALPARVGSSQAYIFNSSAASSSSRGQKSDGTIKTIIEWWSEYSTSFEYLSQNKKRVFAPHGWVDKEAFDDGCTGETNSQRRRVMDLIEELANFRYAGSCIDAAIGLENWRRNQKGYLDLPMLGDWLVGKGREARMDLILSDFQG